MSLRERVEKIWSTNGPPAGIGEFALRLGLRMASWFWWIGSNARRLAFDLGILRSRKVERPVISIGNLTVGGTGKTPIVLEAARILAEAGIRPAVVSRGYRRLDPSTIVVVSDGTTIRTSLQEAGDEPLMMAHHLLAEGIPNVPVVVGAKRADAGKRAIDEFRVNAIILDDGFQHRRLARDCDLVLWDTLRPLESMAMLPRGPMREGLWALRRAHGLIFTRCNLGNPTQKILSRIKRIAPHLVIFRANLEAKSLVRLGVGESLNPADLKGRRIGAFCGLGNPDSFWRLLESYGAIIVARHVFPDHHKPEVAELDAWFAKAKGAGAEWILLTEKDRENLPEGWHPEVPSFVLHTQVSFGEDAERFKGFLLRYAIY